MLSIWTIRGVINDNKRCCYTKERNIKYNELATMSGVTPSTVYSMLNEERRDITITTIKKLCDGLDISLSKFFSDAIFDELDQEIQ